MQKRSLGQSFFALGSQAFSSSQSSDTVNKPLLEAPERFATLAGRRAGDFPSPPLTVLISCLLQPCAAPSAWAAGLAELTSGAGSRTEERGVTEDLGGC